MKSPSTHLIFVDLPTPTPIPTALSTLIPQNPCSQKKKKKVVLGTSNLYPNSSHELQTSLATQENLTPKAKDTNLTPFPILSSLNPSPTHPPSNPKPKKKKKKKNHRHAQPKEPCQTHSPSTTRKKQTQTPTFPPQTQRSTYHSHPAQKISLGKKKKETAKNSVAIPRVLMRCSTRWLGI